MRYRASNEAEMLSGMATVAMFSNRARATRTHDRFTQQRMSFLVTCSNVWGSRFSHRSNVWGSRFSHADARWFHTAAHVVCGGLFEGLGSRSLSSYA